MNIIPENTCPLCNSHMPSRVKFNSSYFERRCSQCQNYSIYYNRPGKIENVDFIIGEYKVLNDCGDDEYFLGETRIYNWNGTTTALAAHTTGIVDWDFSSLDKLKDKLNMLLAFQQ